MLKWIVTLGFLLTSLDVPEQAFAQSRSKVEYITRLGPYGSIRFPQLAPLSSATRKINLAIQREFLEGIGEGKGLTRLLDSTLDLELDGGLTDLADSVYRDDDVLTIDLSIEWMGAYPSHHNTLLSFDTRTGEKLEMRDLIEPARIGEFYSLVREQFLARIQDELTAMRRDMAGYELDSSDLISFEESLTGCLTDSSYDRFGVSRNSVILQRPACLPHVVQAMDIMWRLEFPAVQLRPLLTPYAFSLFEGPKVMLTERPRTRKYFEGTIGKLPVVMLIEEQEKGEYPEVDWAARRGWYYYVKQDEPLELRSIGNSWHFEERDRGSLQKSGEFSGALIGRIFKGTWISADKKKNLPFELKQF
jgi:hypothetical protein